MIEEKLTHFQLALSVYRDAFRGRVGQVVVCSNDSDVEPALKLVRQDVRCVRIGSVMPLRPDAKGQGVVSNKRPTAQATWVRHHLLDAELAASQLPPHGPTMKTPASKSAPGRGGSSAESAKLPGSTHSQRGINRGQGTVASAAIGWSSGLKQPTHAASMLCKDPAKWLSAINFPVLTAIEANLYKKNLIC